MLSARETFHAGVRTIVAGELVEPDDAVVDGNDHLFAVAECPACGGAGADDALEALRVEAEAAATANAELQAKVDELTAALAAASKPAAPAKPAAAKAKD